jgi:hypothetical protein
MIVCLKIHFNELVSLCTDYKYQYRIILSTVLPDKLIHTIHERDCDHLTKSVTIYAIIYMRMTVGFQMFAIDQLAFIFS